MRWPLSSLSLTTRLGLDNVHFHGFANQSVLPQIYGAADVFVLPSENEPWGLAVNEAMCAGLPIVASAEVGCVADLVRAGVNGQTFAAGDVEGLGKRSTFSSRRQGDPDAHERRESRHHLALELRRMRGRAASSARSVAEWGPVRLGRSRTIGG